MNVCWKLEYLISCSWLILALIEITSSSRGVNLIVSDGYPLEIHEVITNDGYILELHRIPRGRNASTYGLYHRKRVVFIPNCLYCASSSFVALGPTKSLAYMLANAGYDVWLMNGRGTEYSNKHVSLSPRSEEFWKFSFHEHGIYDVPASIDYILNLTGEDHVDYIGYSMGGTMYFILMSEKPEYKYKIRSVIAIASAVYLNSSTGYVPSTSPYTTLVAKVSANTGQLKVSAADLGLNTLFAKVCDPQFNAFLESTCTKILEAYGGSRLVDRRLLPFIFKSFPGPTSVRTLVHFAQFRNSAQFEKYNFGRKKNYINYESPVPPLYNLSRATTPIHFFYGALDDWVQKNDVERLISEVPNVASITLLPTYSHLDFSWAVDAHYMVYDVILEQLKQNTMTYNCC